ncbi:MAG: hypothetical protein RLZZ08_1823, partial [Pseudomonadota bacterium]
MGTPADIANATDVTAAWFDIAQKWRLRNCIETGKTLLDIDDATGIAGSDLLDQIFQYVDQMLWIDRACGTENIYISPAYETMWGESMESLRRSGGRWSEAIHPDDRDMVIGQVTDRRPKGLPLDLEYRVIHTDGSVRWVWVKGFPVLDDAGQPDIYIGTATDVTQRKQQEIELARLQSSKDIGSMAADLAHNFNNLLSIIELTLASASHGTSATNFTAKVTTIQNAIRRGKEITGSLLSIASRQQVTEERVDVNEAIRQLMPLITASVGATNRVAFDLSTQPCEVRLDQPAFGQAIINLVSNSRDAMRNDGMISIRTRLVDRSETGGDAGDLAVEVIVADTGPGMDEQALQQATMPFFTTKPRGKGTGLGLAMVYGFVKQSRGNIRIYSEVGVGTTFTIYLPVADNAMVSQPIPASARALTGRASGTVLIVDDEVDL